MEKSNLWSVFFLGLFEYQNVMSITYVSCSSFPFAYLSLKLGVISCRLPLFFVFFPGQNLMVLEVCSCIPVLVFEKPSHDKSLMMYSRIQFYVLFGFF
jgi:hypothetical protein